MSIAAGLESFMSAHEIDYTIFYRELSRESFQTSILSQNGCEKLLDFLSVSFYQPDLTETQRMGLLSWLENYQQALQISSVSASVRSKRMNQVNPYFILRNYLVVSALEQFESGSREMMDRLLVALKTPYEENSVTSLYYARRPEWARNRAGASALSCSS